MYMEGISFRNYTHMEFNLNYKQCSLFELNFNNLRQTTLYIKIILMKRSYRSKKKCEKCLMTRNILRTHRSSWQPAQISTNRSINCNSIFKDLKYSRCFFLTVNSGIFYLDYSRFLTHLSIVALFICNLADAIFIGQTHKSHSRTRREFCMYIDFDCYFFF